MEDSLEVKNGTDEVVQTDFGIKIMEIEVESNKKPN